MVQESNYIQIIFKKIQLFTWKESSLNLKVVLARYDGLSIFMKYHNLNKCSSFPDTCAT